MKEQEVLENKIEKRLMRFYGKSCPLKGNESRADKQMTVLNNISETFSKTGYVASKRDSLGCQCNPSDLCKQDQSCLIPM